MAKAVNIKRRRLNRAGRPKNEDAIRTPSGAISRGSLEVERKKLETERAAMSTVLERRSRFYNVNAKDAQDPLMGSVLGRLYKGKQIDKELYDAGNAYAEAMTLYYHLVLGQSPSVRAQTLFSIGGYAGETSTEQAARARASGNRFAKYEGAFMATGSQWQQVKGMMWNVCVLDDEPEDGWPSHMISLLKVGLRAARLDK